MLVLNMPPAEHPDVLCRKLSLEALQIAASAMHLRGEPVVVLRLNGEPYKPTHLHHPLVRWAAMDGGHVRWLLLYAAELQDDLAVRGKNSDAILASAENAHSSYPKYQDIPPHTTDYARAYAAEKVRRWRAEGREHLRQWTNRPVPAWAEQQ